MSQALQEMAVHDLADIDPVLVAEEGALLMFEAIDYRAFASAKRSYDSAKPEDQATMAQENPMMLLVHELTYEAGIEQVRQRKREAQARKEALRKQP